MVRSRSLPALLALTVVLSGCGGDDAPSARPTVAGPSAATERAEQAAARAERKAARLAREKAQLEATRPSTQPAPELPAGSAEIDGAGGTGSASGSLFSAADARSFKTLAAKLSGAEGIAVAAIGKGTEVSTLGSFDGGVAWSTSKVPIAMAAIKAGTASDADLRQAITASDNAAAERLWTGLGAPAQAAKRADAQLRAAGDTTTRMESKKLRGEFTAFGQTAWGLADQARFAAGMGCTTQGPKVLALMGQVIGGQRWGLGATGPAAQLKGGWGPGVSPGTGDGWLDRQFGVILVGGRKLAVALASTAPEHGAGTANLTELARWTAAHVRAADIPEDGC